MKLHKLQIYKHFKYVTFYSVGPQINIYSLLLYKLHLCMIQEHYCTHQTLNHKWVRFSLFILTKTHIYTKLKNILRSPQLSDALWKQVFYLNLNYCKQSNSIIVTIYKMLSITHKHMQCSTDGQLQIINYIPLVVAEINFLPLHYPSWGTKF